MSVLRVSSYRKIFDEHNWRGNGSFRTSAALPSIRSRVVDCDSDCYCDKLDFKAAKVLNKEGLSKMFQERSVIANLNDRLVQLIELARCVEEENEHLQLKIQGHEDDLDSGVVVQAGHCLDDVVEQLERDRDQMLCEAETLRRQVFDLKMEQEKVVQKRLLVQQQQQDVAQEVDATTVECLALRNQTRIYEQLLLKMEAEHQAEVQDLLTDGATAAMRVKKFKRPDLSAALDLKARYCHLLDDIRHTSGSTCSPAADEHASATDDDVKLITPEEQELHELQELQELQELHRSESDLQDELEMKRSTYPEEIAQLESRASEMRRRQSELSQKMKHQCEEYQELLEEKMYRDMEITAYRNLVQEEDQRLRDL